MSKNVVPVVVGKYTFLVTKNSNFVIHTVDKGFTATRIVDGIHNNGGWEVHEPAEKVVQKFVDAYNQLG